MVRPYQSMDYVIQLRNMVSLGLWSEMMDDIVNDDMNFLDLKVKFVLLFIPNFVFWFCSPSNDVEDKASRLRYTEGMTRLPLSDSNRAR